MSQEIMQCKAIVQQGPRKNQSCRRIPTDNPYCTYHQRNYEHEMALKNGKNICGMFFRGCNEERSEEDIKKNYSNCITCRTKKYHKEFKCQAKDCKFTIKKEENKYCKKHIRNLLHDDEKVNDIRYCDIERGCFQPIIHGSSCDTCKQYEKSKLSPTIALLRKTYHVSLENITSTPLHQYQEDSTISVAELWRCVQKNAYIRGLLFTLSESDFENLIIQPCYYCGFQSASRLNGIDRVDNNKGYIITNCISCCKMCNVIKNTQHPIEFLDKVASICNYYLHKHSISEEIILKWESYLSTGKREKYKEYIHTCKNTGLEMLLSEREYNQFIQGVCYLCGITNRSNHSNGIDRFDSSIRCYSIENSRSCCGHCNVMKGALIHSDFIYKCMQIYNRNCNRSMFLLIPIYTISKCRNESYTAEDIYLMMINGKYKNYLEWCKEKEKSPEFISAINEIRHHIDITNKSVEMIQLISSELEKERSRKSHKDDTKKHMHCTTLYCYLTQGKKDDFIDWYETNHTKTSLFDSQFEELISKLPIISKTEGIELCKKFMYDEKNRRNTQLRREMSMKVVAYSKPVQTAILNTIVYPPLKLEPVAQKVKMIQEQKGYHKVDLPKQWKTKQINEFIQSHRENEYKIYCEQNNDMSKFPNWEKDWMAFILSVKGNKEAEPIIKAFVENLRQIRHNQLCAKDIVEKEDREIWPAITVAKAFLEGKLEKFKAYTEAHTGENANDPKWMKRWSAFVESLEKNRDHRQELKNQCSKFMAAQRIKKYRQST